jgi:protein-disulfide isomerase/uncharacterized membrane protein
MVVRQAGNRAETGFRAAPAAGVACLSLSAAMSLLLVLEHLGGLSLPGCGEASACAQVTHSAWGRLKLGGLEWPVAYLGFAYFAAALVTWIGCRGAVPRVFRHLVRFGALLSLVFCVVLLSRRLLCPYCLAVHLGNFGFWITAELAGTCPGRTGRAAVLVVIPFLCATGLLGLVDAGHRAAVQKRAEREREQAARRIIEQAAKAGVVTTAATVPGGGRTTEIAAEAGAPTPPASRPTGPVFTGRHRIGPEDAPIRIVMFTGYQCPDCYAIEQQLQRLHDTRQDISISIKHFPFTADCNPHVTRTMHPNGCWAARAAEAAGLLWGAEGFWKMHAWLFTRRGRFETQQELEAGIRELGYDPAGFVQVMSGEQTLQAIREDADEAQSLGLFYTPMIFINGVELKGWNAPEALVRTVEQVASANPPRRSARFDTPPLALDKYIADWRDQPVRTQPAENHTWSSGKPDAPIQVVLWGDYQETGTAQVDGIIRAFAARRGNVRYVYRHFPFNSECNPIVGDQRHPNACRAALAAEAAGRLAGNEGYWRLHAWLMENRQNFSDDTLRGAVAAIGLDAGSFFTTMSRPETRASILEDVQASRLFPPLRIGVPAGIHAVPTIFVNGRFVPRWMLGDKPILDRILEEAGRG